MIATAVMWYAFGKVMEAEAEFDELEPDSGDLPLYFTLGPLVLDAWAFWCLALGLGGT